MDDYMSISIFGLGYVGSVSAACLASKQFNIIGVDSSQEKVDMINAAKPLIIEPELKKLTEEAVFSGRLRATMDVHDAVVNSQLSFICVGTPSQKNNALDLQYIRRVCEDIGLALKNKKEYHIVACRSTMFTGTMKQVVIPLLEQFSGKKEGRDFSACINPEFMKEGTAVYDYFNPPLNVVGSADQRVQEVFDHLNTVCTQMPTVFIEIEAAELVKYASNIWHALKVGFANEIGNVCKSLNIDSHELMHVFCQDTKLNISSYYLKPGFAFGGSCLPKDVRAFLHESQQLNIQVPIIRAILPSNELQIDHALDMIVSEGNKRVGILGFSFKAHTDDLRESPLVAVIERLIGKGYEVTFFDKNVLEASLHGANRDYILNHIPHITQLMVHSIDELLARSETIVIGNRAEEFDGVLEHLREDQVVIDLVRIRKQYPESKQYKGICWA